MFKLKIPRQMGQAVKEKRLKMGLTQLQLAELSDTSRSLIYRLEKGATNGIALDKLFDVLRALDLQLAVLDEESQSNDIQAAKAPTEADHRIEEEADHSAKSTNQRKAAAKDNLSRNSQAEFEKQLKAAQNIKGFDVLRYFGE